jgi:acyl transferase domain-containing protein
MIQRDVQTPAIHTFLPIKLGRGQEPMATISSATTNLWRESIRVSFFNFGTVGVNQVWLPPYAFERTPAWLPYVDPATEALKHVPTPITAMPQVAVRTAPQRLVNPTASPKQFSIGTNTDRFKSIVAGHNVIGNPLCPSALYLESAIIASQYSFGTVETYGYIFWDYRIDAPLGNDHRRDVLLDIEGNSTSAECSFVLKSTLRDQPKITMQAKASFKFFASLSGQEASHFQSHQRFVKARLGSFSSNPIAEIFKMNRAYRLFSRVVNYSSILTGIASITMAGNEVMAELNLPTASITKKVLRFLYATPLPWTILSRL